MDEYKAVYEGGVGEIIEKKSRFIASVWPVESEEEALEKIEQCRKKYWDASHNCFAYVIGRKQQIQRCSDDGEPGGTAGKPMLDVLLGQKLYNVVTVVTRYFGGTLLGTGGLVRAYQKSVQKGLEESVIIEKKSGRKIRISTDYTGIGKIQYIIGQMGLNTLGTEYAASVDIFILAELDKVEKFRKKVMEATSAKAEIEEQGTVYFAKIAGEIKIFETM